MDDATAPESLDTIDLRQSVYYSCSEDDPSRRLEGAILKHNRENVTATVDPRRLSRSKLNGVIWLQLVSSEGQQFERHIPIAREEAVRCW
jgi:hypothetical protein